MQDNPLAVHLLLLAFEQLLVAANASIVERQAGPMHAHIQTGLPPVLGGWSPDYVGVACCTDALAHDCLPWLMTVCPAQQVVRSMLWSAQLVQQAL